MRSTRSTAPVSADDDIDTRIGARLQAQRQQHGMSRAALGARIGVTFQQIEKYERGKSRIAASTLFALAQVFSVPPSHFLDIPATAVDPGATALEEEVLAFMRTPECTELVGAVQRIRRTKVRRQIVLFLRGITEGE